MLSHVEINGSMFVLFQWLVTSQEKTLSCFGSRSYLGKWYFGSVTVFYFWGKKKKVVERCCKITVISWEGPSVSNIMNSGSL